VVSKGRLRFAQDRLAGLADAPRSGKPRTYRAAADQGILALLDRPPPAGQGALDRTLDRPDIGRRQ
jgi:hypothetical protein